MAKLLGGPAEFKSAMNNYRVSIYRINNETIFGSGAYSFNNVILPNNAFNSSDSWAKGQTVHELAHVWDTRNGLSAEMMFETHSYINICHRSACIIVYDPNSAIEDSPTDYGMKNKNEDWAESVKVLLYPILSERPLGRVRKEYIEKAINNLQ